MSTRISFWRFLATLTLLGEFVAPAAAVVPDGPMPAPPNAPSAPAPFIDDEEIVQRLETEGTSLIKAGKTTRLRTLRAQLLKDHTCSLSLPSAVPLPGSAPGALYSRCAPGVLVVGVLAKVKKRARYEVAACSGFALAADGVFVTNYHVIDSPEGEAIVVMTKEGQITPVSEVLAADKLTDVAIVRAAGATFTPLQLAFEPPPVGSAIWVISHPDHNFFSLTSGIVSRHFIAVTDHGKTPQFAVTADFGAGSSGGPILNADGHVLGIVCSTTSVYWQDDKSKVNDLQMVFKHCVPVDAVRQLLGGGAPEAQRGVTHSGLGR